MSRDFPDWVDCARAAAGNRRFEGSMPLSWLERLSGVVARGTEPDRTEVAFSITFGLDEQGQVRVDTRVRGELPLVCQRTLEVFLHPLDSGSRVAIVGSERLARSLPENDEPMVCEDGRVALKSLVEEEVLLALPLVPVRPGSEPVTASAGRVAGEKSAGPFSELARLKKD